MPGTKNFERCATPSPVPAPPFLKPRLAAGYVKRELQQPSFSQPQQLQLLPHIAAVEEDPQRFAWTAGLTVKPQIDNKAEQGANSVARLPGGHPSSHFSGGSSGSEHEPSSEYLAGLVSHFMEIGGQSPLSRPASYGEEDDDDKKIGSLEVASSVQALSTCASPLESSLLSDVLCAIQLSCPSTPGLASDPDCSNHVHGPEVRRAVMSRLRAAGYNAAVCKSRWDHSRGFPGGDYEYIDILLSADASAAARERLVVDLDFRAQFQVARPTPHFEAALMAAPVVFVGRADRLQQLVEVLADACRKSLKMQGMHLPPWRKVEYLRAKWLAPYKRTTNAVGAPAASAQEKGRQDLSTMRQTSFSVPAVAPAAHVPAFGFCKPAEAPLPKMRNCQPLHRRAVAPRGVLGKLLQEQIGCKPAPVM